MPRPGSTCSCSLRYGGTGDSCPAMQLVLGEITVVGNLIGTRADLEDLVMLTAQGKVVLHSHPGPAESRQMMRSDQASASGPLRGRAILSPG